VLGERDGPRVRVVAAVKRIILGAAFVATAALSAQAASIKDGKYTGTGDGPELSLKIKDETATIATTVYRQCSGGGTGQISEVAEGRWRITLTEHGACLVDVRRTADGYELSPIEGGSCEAYSGFACGLGGTVSAQ
jgi:hypothetical protein